MAFYSVALGFEPREPFSSTAFKAVAINHSAKLPFRQGVAAITKAPLSKVSFRWEWLESNQQPKAFRPLSFHRSKLFQLSYIPISCCLMSFWAQQMKPSYFIANDKAPKSSQKKWETPKRVSSAGEVSALPILARYGFTYKEPREGIESSYPPGRDI